MCESTSQTIVPSEVSFAADPGSFCLASRVDKSSFFSLKSKSTPSTGSTLMSEVTVTVPVSQPRRF